MKQEPRHVNFYRLTLLRGCFHEMKRTPGCTLAVEGMRGVYLSRVVDTGEENLTLNRLVVDGTFEGAKLEVIVTASNNREDYIGDELRDLDAYFQDPDTSPKDKADHLTRLPHVRYVNTQDILLHSLNGRYVWIYVAVYPMDDAVCELEGLRLEYPKYSFTEYFPEIYQGNEFFDRYIAVFQSMFLDAERVVDRIPSLLDYETTPDEQVEYLASWLGIDNERRIFTPAQLRHIIANIDLFQGAKGTKRALEELVFLATGIRPRIVEHFRWSRDDASASHTGTCRRLYGETANHFCVILDLSRREAPLPVSESDLETLVEAYSVLGAQFKIVCLRLCNHTDAHCYLDINAAISVPEVASIEGGTFGAHITVG